MASANVTGIDRQSAHQDASAQQDHPTTGDGNTGQSQVAGQTHQRDGSWLSVVVHGADPRERVDTALHTIDMALGILNDARMSERSIERESLNVVAELIAAGRDALSVDDVATSTRPSTRPSTACLSVRSGSNHAGAHAPLTSTAPRLLRVAVLPDDASQYAGFDAATRASLAAEMFGEISGHCGQLEALLRAIAHHAKRHDEHDPDLRQLVTVALEWVSNPEHTSQCDRLKACLAAMEREATAMEA